MLIYTRNLTLTNKEIIQGLRDTSVDEDYDPDDSCVLPNVSIKEVLRAIITLKNYILHHKKNILNRACSTRKIKDKRGSRLKGVAYQIVLTGVFPLPSQLPV